MFLVTTIFLMVIFIGLMLLLRHSDQLYNKNENAMKSNKKCIDEFIKNNELKNYKKFISKDYSSGIILNKDKNEIIFISNKYKKKSNGAFEYNFKTIPSTMIISSEVLIDKQSVISVQRGNQLKGIAIGSLFGSVGALIGGLSGNKIQKENINSIDMNIIIEDINHPNYKINFLSTINTKTKRNGYAKDSNEFKEAISNVERWYGIIETLIRQQNKVVNN